MIKRPPIVVVMGHVDHGKTTLLDNIRKANVADKEAGGITQSIGAYEIEHGGEKIAFIDTPGHEAFSKMRSHGANVADLAVLVVAADDGIKPQTKEALSAIKSAKIPFVVAINKIDLPTADIEKTKNELTQAEVYLEGRGGDISYQEISAKKGTGVEDLLDLINLAAELEELTCNPDVPGEGVVISSARCKRRGVSVGVIVKNGTFKAGDEVFAENTSGKIKTIENFLGKKIESAEPGSPVLILGLCDLPSMGEKIRVGECPKLESPLHTPELESPLDKAELPSGKDIPIILKANETASLETLKDVVSNLGIEPPLHIVGMGVGDIHENDANLAFCTGAIIAGFGVNMDKSSEKIISSQKIKVITAPIIYELQKALEEYAGEFAKKETGIIDILAVFGDSKGKQIVGGVVSEGEVKNQSEFTVAREGDEVGKGKITNLQSQKEDVPVVKEGKETGLMIVSEIKIEKGDKLVFREEKLKN